jgi:hypothetical protein
MLPVQNNNYVQQALDLLIEQFRSKSKIAAMITAIVAQLQEAEVVAFQLLTLRSLSTAQGSQLDQIGVVVGLSRLGLSDDAYRAQLKGQILVNTSQGNPERLIEVVRIVTNSALVILHEPTPGYVQISFDGTITQEESIFKAKIDSVAPAGVRLQLVEGTLNNSFRVGTVGDLNDPLRGLSSALDLDHGGKLGRAL